MKAQSIGFIGGGRITRIILQGLNNEQFDLSSVVISDTNPDVLTRLKAQFHAVQTTADNQIAANQQLVFIALHPPVIMEVLDEIHEKISSDAIVISLAPKLSIQKFQAKLNSAKIVRMIPNATSIINEGYNPLCFSKEMSAADRRNILKILEKLGPAFEVEEKQLEAYAIVSAMAPTYFWFQWKKLVELGQEMGLNPVQSEQAVYQSLKAALNVQFNEMLSYEEVNDLIPVKPIGDHETEVISIYEEKLKALFQKISSQT